MGRAGFCVGDGDAGVAGGDLGDGGVVLNHVGGQGACEAVGDAIHAADGLEHCRLPIDLLLVELAEGEVGKEELVEAERFVEDRLGEAASGPTMKPARVVPVYLPLSSRSPKPLRKSRRRVVSSFESSVSRVCWLIALDRSSAR